MIGLGPWLRVGTRTRWVGPGSWYTGESRDILGYLFAKKIMGKLGISFCQKLERSLAWYQSRDHDDFPRYPSTVPVTRACISQYISESFYLTGRIAMPGYHNVRVSFYVGMSRWTWSLPWPWDIMSESVVWLGDLLSLRLDHDIPPGPWHAQADAAEPRLGRLNFGKLRILHPGPAQAGPHESSSSWFQVVAVACRHRHTGTKSTWSTNLHNFILLSPLHSCPLPAFGPPGPSAPQASQAVLVTVESMGVRLLLVDLIAGKEQSMTAVTAMSLKVLVCNLKLFIAWLLVKAAKGWANSTLKGTNPFRGGC